LQFLYRIVYHPLFNPILLGINKLLVSISEFRLPPSGIIYIRIKDGLGFKMATNQTSYVTKLLYWKGSDSFEYTPIFKELISQCDSFIDIGANTGYYSLLAAAVSPECKIYSFEPAQGPLHYLLKNVSLNDFDKKISVQPIALSSQSGEIMFYEVKNKKYTYLPHNLGGVGSLKEDASKLAYSVKTETLDQFISKTSISHIDLIKIDTEGTENSILKGAEESIKKFCPIIICETLFNKIEDKLEVIMKSHGYLFFNHENGHLRKVESLIRSKDDGVRDCFFVHPSKLHLIANFIKT
jgi:FkbM family methyltransferase